MSIIKIFYKFINITPGKIKSQSPHLTPFRPFLRYLAAYLPPIC